MQFRLLLCEWVTEGVLWFMVKGGFRAVMWNTLVSWGYNPILSAFLPMVFYSENIRVSSMYWALFYTLGTNQWVETSPVCPLLAGGCDSFHLFHPKLVRETVRSRESTKHCLLISSLGNLRSHHHCLFQRWPRCRDPKTPTKRNQRCQEKNQVCTLFYDDHRQIAWLGILSDLHLSFPLKLYPIYSIPEVTPFSTFLLALLIQ